jgi:hypothetical protein
MKMLKIFLMTMVLLALFTVPVMGEEDIGIHGAVGFKYELTDPSFRYQSWVMDLHYNFTDWFSVGTTQTTFTNGFGTYFNLIPSFAPTNQLYEFYLQFNVWENTALKLCTWCNHAVDNGTNLSEIQGNGMYLQGIYKF